MKTVGFVGWRGMVGSVLMQRMQEEGDFKNFEAVFYSTSQVGEEGPAFQGANLLESATNLERLSKMDIIVSCQGGDYTKDIHPRLRAKGWKGLWIDAASALRMDADACLVLDPVNLTVIEDSIKRGVKDFVGANCTVSLMLMALSGLFQNNLVEWVSSMTYQAASGAGAKNMIELLKQMQHVSVQTEELWRDPSKGILEIDKAVTEELNSAAFPKQLFGAPLAGSLIPWIDSAMENGQTREEWKGMVETNKILGTKNIPVDGICVRVGAMRCHSQGFTIKLKKDVPLNEILPMLGQANDWVRVIPNDKEATLKHLSTAEVSGSLNVPVGRLRKSMLGEQYLHAFTMGDQLLWGAAEPLRRVLNLLLHEA